MAAIRLLAGLLNCPYLHPVLISIYIMLFPSVNGAYQASIGSICNAAIIFAAVTLLLYILLSLLMRNKTQAGILASEIILILFSFSYVWNTVKGKYLSGIFIGKQSYLLCVYSIAAILVIGLSFKLRKNKTLITITNAFNFSAVLLIGWLLFSNGAHFGSSKSVISDAYYQQLMLHSQKAKCTSVCPNIYYIILDSYPRSDILSSYYHFDNSSFIGELEKRGFYVASRSTSNYAFTHYSVASSLNCNYIDSIVFPGKELNNIESIIPALLNNRVDRILGHYGYSDINIAPWFEHRDVRPIQYAFQQSILLPFYQKIWVDYDQRKRIISAFDTLSRLETKSNTPLFVYDHILCPHGPFVFDRNGNAPKYIFKLKHIKDMRTQFLKQLEFVNYKILMAISKIQLNHTIPPIIIIQGDHGSAYMDSPFIDSDEKPDSLFLCGQMSILNAFLVPENIKAKLYPAITPVNAFRLVLSSLFNEHLPLIEDKNYYSSHRDPANFIDVTMQLKDCK